MNGLMKKLSRISLLVLSLFMWSCDNLGESTAPELTPDGAAVYNTQGRAFVVARSPISAGSVTAEIGEAGGQLLLGKHRLIVPKGAVSEAATFTMSLRDGEYLRFSLSATKLTHNDVGSAGFAVPLELHANYEDVSELPADLSSLKVIYFRPDGLVEEQETSVDVQGKRAIGRIGHFSDFGLAWPGRLVEDLL